MAEARPQVVHEEDAPFERHERWPNMASRIPIPPGASQQLCQRVFRSEAGDPRWWMEHGGQEEIAYVATGRGWIDIKPGPESINVREGTAILIPPGHGYRFGSTSDQFVLVSILAPAFDQIDRESDENAPLPPVAIHESDQEALPAGEDRYFKVLLDPRHGAKHVTQFVGFIEKSRAPFHTHTYEEAIYILEGDGIVHIQEASTPIRPGTSIFLPPGTPHCLENAGSATLKLLGVFSPPGSPANRMESA